MRDTTGITPHIAATTLYHLNLGRNDVDRYVGYPPSHWRGLLLELIVNSDPSNRALLARGFPGEVKAVDLAEHCEGVEILCSIAREAGQG